MHILNFNLLKKNINKKSLLFSIFLYKNLKELNKLKIFFNLKKNIFNNHNLFFYYNIYFHKLFFFFPLNFFFFKVLGRFYSYINIDLSFFCKLIFFNRMFFLLNLNKKKFSYFLNLIDNPPFYNNLINFLKNKKKKQKKITAKYFFVFFCFKKLILKNYNKNFFSINFLKQKLNIEKKKLKKNFNKIKYIKKNFNKLIKKEKKNLKKIKIIKKIFNKKIKKLKKNLKKIKNIKKYLIRFNRKKKNFKNKSNLKIYRKKLKIKIIYSKILNKITESFRYPLMDLKLKVFDFFFFQRIFLFENEYFIIFSKLISKLLKKGMFGKSNKVLTNLFIYIKKQNININLLLYFFLKKVLPVCGVNLIKRGSYEFILPKLLNKTSATNIVSTWLYESFFGKKIKNITDFLFLEITNCLLNKGFVFLKFLKLTSAVIDGAQFLKKKYKKKNNDIFESNFNNNFNLKKIKYYKNIKKNIKKTIYIKNKKNKKNKIRKHIFKVISSNKKYIYKNKKVKDILKKNKDKKDNKDKNDKFFIFNKKLKRYFRKVKVYYSNKDFFYFLKNKKKRKTKKLYFSLNKFYSDIHLFNFTKSIFFVNKFILKKLDLLSFNFEKILFSKAVWKKYIIMNVLKFISKENGINYNKVSRLYDKFQINKYQKNIFLRINLYFILIKKLFEFKNKEKQYILFLNKLKESFNLKKKIIKDIENNLKKNNLKKNNLKKKIKKSNILFYNLYLNYFKYNNLKIKNKNNLFIYLFNKKLNKIKHKLFYSSKKKKKKKINLFKELYLKRFSNLLNKLSLIDHSIKSLILDKVSKTIINLDDVNKIKDVLGFFYTFFLLFNLNNDFNFIFKDSFNLKESFNNLLNNLFIINNNNNFNFHGFNIYLKKKKKSNLFFKFLFNFKKVIKNKKSRRKTNYFLYGSFSNKNKLKVQVEENLLSKSKFSYVFGRYINDIKNNKKKVLERRNNEIVLHSFFHNYLNFLGFETVYYSNRLNNLHKLFIFDFFNKKIKNKFISKIKNTFFFSNFYNFFNYILKINNNIKNEINYFFFLNKKNFQLDYFFKSNFSKKKIISLFLKK